MRVCSICVLACAMGAGVARGEVVQYIFNGQFGMSPFAFWSWTIWIDTDAMAIPVNENTVRYEDAFYSELTFDTTTYTGTAYVNLLINDFSCCGDLNLDRMDIDWVRDPGQRAPSRFELGFVTKQELFDSPELRSEPGVVGSDGSGGFYQIRQDGVLYSGEFETYFLEIVPAPSAFGLFAMAGVVGARRRR